MDFQTLLIAFSLVLIIEGLGPTLIPKQWQTMLAELSQLPVKQLRLIGLGLVLTGWLSFLFVTH